MKTYDVILSDRAQKDRDFWKKNSPKDFRKLLELLEELEHHPRTGTGNPKQLREKGKYWSRHINKKDIIKYKIFDDKVYVYVASARGHYDDH